MCLSLICLKIVFILANSTDPDEMLLYAAFHLCLFCLPKYLFAAVRKKATSDKVKFCLNGDGHCSTRAHEISLRARNVQASLFKCADWPEPLLLAYTKYGCR